MAQPTNKIHAAEPNDQKETNSGITKRVMVHKTRTSPIKVFLRITYWTFSIAVVAVILYLGFEVGMLFYQHAPQK